MKRIAAIFLFAAFVLVAGCITGPHGGSPAGSPTAPVLTGTEPGDEGLPFTEPAILVNGSISVTASIDHIETGSQGAGQRTIDIYIRAKNTGTEPIALTWYSTLKDNRGVSYGGIGTSHGGTGARTSLLYPGYAETARDYVTIPDAKSSAVLREGASLDVWFFTVNAAGQPSAALRSAWKIDAGRI